MLIPDLAAVLGSAFSGDFGEQADAFGPALAVPLRSTAGISGVLLAVRDKDGGPFEPELVPVLPPKVPDRAISHLPVPEGTLVPGQSSVGCRGQDPPCRPPRLRGSLSLGAGRCGAAVMGPLHGWVSLYGVGVDELSRWRLHHR
jgi:hypothetical protein